MLRVWSQTSARCHEPGGWHLSLVELKTQGSHGSKRSLLGGAAAFVLGSLGVTTCGGGQRATSKAAGSHSISPGEVDDKSSPDKPFLCCITSSPSSWHRWDASDPDPDLVAGDHQGDPHRPTRPVSTESVTTRWQQCGTAALSSCTCHQDRDSLGARPTPAASVTRVDAAPSLPAGRMLWAGPGGCLSTRGCPRSGCHAVNAPRPWDNPAGSWGGQGKHGLGPPVLACR